MATIVSAGAPADRNMATIVSAHAPADRNMATIVNAGAPDDRNMANMATIQSEQVHQLTATWQQYSQCRCTS